MVCFCHTGKNAFLLSVPDSMKFLAARYLKAISSMIYFWLTSCVGIIQSGVSRLVLVVAQGWCCWTWYKKNRWIFPKLEYYYYFLNTWWSFWWRWLWRTFFVWHGTFWLSLTCLYPIFFHCNWSIDLKKNKQSYYCWTILFRSLDQPVTKN